MTQPPEWQPPDSGPRQPAIPDSRWAQYGQPPSGEQPPDGPPPFDWPPRLGEPDGSVPLDPPKRSHRKLILTTVGVFVVASSAAAVAIVLNGNGGNQVITQPLGQTVNGTPASGGSAASLTSSPPDRTRAAAGPGGTSTADQVHASSGPTTSPTPPGSSPPPRPSVTAQPSGHAPVIRRPTASPTPPGSSQPHRPTPARNSNPSPRPTTLPAPSGSSPRHRPSGAALSCTAIKDVLTSTSALRTGRLSVSSGGKLPAGTNPLPSGVRTMTCSIRPVHPGPAHRSYVGSLVADATAIAWRRVTEHAFAAEYTLPRYLKFMKGNYTIWVDTRRNLVVAVSTTIAGQLVTFYPLGDRPAG